MRKIGRRMLTLALFAALVAALLRFQGVIGPDEPLALEVPGPPALAAGARTARVERRALPSELTLLGFVEPVDPAEVAPRVLAAVASVEVRAGDEVEAGALLAALDDRDARARLAQAEASREAASARARAAELEHERASRLSAADAGTARDLERASAERDAARADASRAEQSVEEARAALAWYRVEAPISGRVLERLAEPGSLAVPGQPICTLFDPARLRARVAVPEQHAAALTAGVEVPLEVAAGIALTGRVDRVLPPADPRSGTVDLFVDLAADAGLRPGLLVRARVPIGTREALLVPAAAVERIGQIELARLVRAGRSVPVTVRTGKVHGELVEVLSGLAAGEEVLLP